MTYQRFFSRAADVMQESAIRKMGVAGARIPGVISFAPGYPATEAFPWEALREIAGDLLTGQDPRALQYGLTRGHPPLIEAIRGVLAGRGIQAASDEVLITTGSQQGLDLVARVLLNPGDVALVELPTYTGAITAFRNAQARLAGVPQESDGISIDALDDTLRRLRAEGCRVPFLYLVPNFQNPTGLLVGLAKRRRLLEWAERRDLLIVEDDPYGELYFEDRTTSADTRPLKADDAEGRVLYLSSFSKTLAPGLRIAWATAAAPIIAKLDTAKQAADLCSGALDQRLVLAAIDRGLLAAQGPRLRQLYQVRRDAMERALSAALGDTVTWQTPRGGFFLWAALPPAIDAERMLEAATAHKVIYVVGSAFFVDGRGPNLIRLSFSQPGPADIAEGIRRLGVVVRETLANAYSMPATTVRTTSSPSG